MAELARGADLLTRHDGQVVPEEATTDMTFEQAADDTEYRHVVVRELDYPWFVRIFVPSGGSALAWLALSPLVALSVVLARVAVKAGLRRRRRRARS